MGSSQRKKREKKKDFQVYSLESPKKDALLNMNQKVKLKVGKARPKAANFTDTSFRARCKMVFPFEGICIG